MGQFIDNGSEIVIVDDVGGRSIYDRTWWMADAETGYALPTDSILQYYRQTEVYAYHLPEEAIIVDTAWTDGDGYIAKKLTYDTEYSAYLDSLLNLPDAKTKVIGAMTAFGDNISSNGGVVYSTHTFESNSTFLGNLLNDTVLYSGGLPVDYYINDVDYNPIPFSNLSDVDAIIDLIIQLGNTCNINEDTHRAAIEALTTPESVLAYDYTTGYPTVPFSP